MPTVLNRRHGWDGVYVGRPTKWGNPFVIGRDGDRDEVVRKYREYAWSQFDDEDILELAEADALICWCAPLACHADVLVEMIEALPNTEGE